MTFIRKNATKDAGNRVMNAAVRGGGLLAAAYASNGTPLKEQYPKAHGLVFLGLGLLGEVFIADEKLNSFAQGLTSFGVLKTVTTNVLPGSAADFGQATVALPASTETMGAVENPLPGTPEKSRGLTLQDLDIIAQSANAADAVAENLLTESETMGEIPVPNLADLTPAFDAANSLTSN